MTITSPSDQAERMAVAFARVLRGAGLEVPVGAVVTYAEALGVLGIAQQSAVYWAGRTTLVRHIEDVPIYDRAFDAFWLRRASDVLAADVEEEHLTLLLDDDDMPEGEEGETLDERDVVTVRFSAHEVLRHKDFAAYSRAELDEARRLMADLRLAGALRPSRRKRRSRRGEGTPRPSSHRASGAPIGR